MAISTLARCERQSLTDFWSILKKIKDCLFMKAITLNQRIDLKNALHEINQTTWPSFILHWHCPAWSNLFSTFMDYQILFLNDKDDLLAFGHTIPIYWKEDLREIPDDLKTLIEMGVISNQKGIKPNVLLALAAVVPEKYKGKGLSSVIVKEMKNIAIKKGLKYLIVPVRPTLKSRYPLIPIENYAKWKREDGLFFDPWLRVHQKLGGKIFKTAKLSMIIEGNVKEWEEWTGTKIFESGHYLFEGVLNPVEISCEKDMGIYFDPCIWVKYTLNDN